MFFKYIMTQRRFGIGNQPKGARLLVEGAGVEGDYYALIECDAPLTDDEVYSFDLKQCAVTSYEVLEYVNAQESVDTIEHAQELAKHLAKQLASERGLPQYVAKALRIKISVFRPED
jgi:hypothetical protein